LGFGLELRDRVLGLRDGNFRGNEALVCRPEMPRLGGPPERSEGGEGHRMAGPLHANEGKNSVNAVLVEVTSFLKITTFLTFPSKSRTSARLSEVTK
jgi:hypothetical protein